jgi:large subunit ribosomal protein L33
MRVNITLACTETGNCNYITIKNKRNNPERMEMKKFSHCFNRFSTTSKMS